MPSLTYTMDQFPILSCDGSEIAYVDGEAILYLDDTQNDQPVIEHIEVTLRCLRTGNKTELRQKDKKTGRLNDQAYIDIIQEQFERLLRDGNIDPYDGMEPEEFHAATAADFARDDRLSREAA
ncbi:MAG: hypothetical protein M9937_26385 [Chelatococcus sp.]|uniref:hypothetical protein n=1 Tax=Chelatococcus sp. TaxID=1953771 RepID=UPI00224BB239|nr:hypothetical protein [Chelatococcus sp.]MCO5079201.1 hypothetical protein [Chelatococcus sp.]CAH1678221.1 hypothetical protein CHELA41_24505 [Hyphomicrobiales bacterium]